MATYTDYYKQLCVRYKDSIDPETGKKHTYEDVIKSVKNPNGSQPTKQSLIAWCNEAKLKEDYANITMDNLCPKINSWAPYVLEGIIKRYDFQQIFLKTKKISFEETFLKVNIKSEYQNLLKILKRIYERNERIPNRDILMTEYNICSENVFKEYELDDEAKANVNNVFVDLCQRHTSTEDLQRYFNDFVKFMADYEIAGLVTELKTDRDFEKISKIADKYNELKEFQTVDNDEITNASDLFEEYKPILRLPFFAEGVSKKMNHLPAGVSVLVGGYGTGKTCACINQEIYLARKGIASIHFAAGDLQKNSIGIRLLACLSGRKQSELERNPNLQKKLYDEYQDILKYIYVSAKRRSAKEFVSVAKNLIRKCEYEGTPIPQFICVDYDENVSSDKQDIASQMDDIYSTFQDFGLDYNICVLCVSQVVRQDNDSKNSKSKTNGLTASDIAGGEKKKRIAANIITMFSGEASTYSKGATLKPIVFKALKVRNGEFDPNYEQTMFFEGATCRFMATEQANKEDFNSKIENNEWIGD